MHEDEKYLEALYCLQEKSKKKVIEFAEQSELMGKDAEYFDTMMHAAKNLRKEIIAEEIGDVVPPEIAEYSGITQGYGRAIRTTPGMDGGSMRGGNGGGSRRSYDGGSMRGGNSMKRDSRGRYTRAGGSYGGSWNSYGGGSYGGSEGEEMIKKLRKRADMTTDHDERERFLAMIDWLEEESQQ